MSRLPAPCQAHSKHLINVWIHDWIVSLRCKTLTSCKNSCILTAGAPFRLLGIASCPGAGPVLLPSFSPLGSFSIEILPQHAATCGETSPPHPASPSSSSSSSLSVLWVSSESSSPVSWVQCPICQLQFSAGEVEEHASMCGELPQA